jgi:hypothetical protein
METLETMTYEVTGRIARVTLNRPEWGNGITLDLPRELAEGRLCFSAACRRCGLQASCAGA